LDSIAMSSNRTVIAHEAGMVGKARWSPCASHQEVSFIEGHGVKGVVFYNTGYHCLFVIDKDAPIDHSGEKLAVLKKLQDDWSSKQEFENQWVTVQIPYVMLHRDGFDCPLLGVEYRTREGLVDVSFPVREITGFDEVGAPIWKPKGLREIGFGCQKFSYVLQDESVASTEGEWKCLVHINTEKPVSDIEVEKMEDGWKFSILTENEEEESSYLGSWKVDDKGLLRRIFSFMYELYKGDLCMKGNCVFPGHSPEEKAEIISLLS